MRRAVLLVALFGALLVLPRLGHRQIIGSHEAVFPIVARDIVDRHAWLSAELRGLPYRNKPPLYPWAIAAFSWPGGRVTEITARLPGALAAIGAAVVTALLGAQLFGARAGLWAALILLTSIVFFDHAVTTIPDLLMVFFDLLAGLALWALRDGGSRRALLGFYVALALAVFTKGIPGLLPLGVALVWLAIDGGRPALRRLVWLPGLAVFAVATAIWLVPYVTADRGGFATTVVWRDWLWGPLGGLRPATLGTQVLYGVLGFLPWTLVLPLALVAAVRMRRVRPVAFALCWFVVQTALVFAAQQQRLRYLLPLIPGAALLVAWWADREAGARPRRALAVVAFGVALLGAIAMPFALDRVEMTLRVSVWEIAVVMLGIVTVGAVAAAALSIGRLAVAVPAVVGVSAVVLLSAGWIVDDWENRAWDYRSAAVDLRKIAAPLAVAALVDDHELLQVDFYLGRALPPLRSAEAVRAHLMTRHGAVVVETARGRATPPWLPLEPGHLHADALGADVLVVTDGVR